MRTTVLGILVLLLIIGGIVDATRATAGEEPSDGVATGTIPFEAGKATPPIEHELIKVRSVETTIAKPNLQTGKQKISLKVIVDNLGETHQKVIVTVALLGSDENILDAVAVKEDVGENKTFKVKFNMLRQHVKLVQSIRFEVSSPKD
jgi:hypothetical protein